MKSVEIRETFLKFFENYHHQRVKSSGLIPAADPTLLFTAAGMVQFKDCFLGVHDPGYRRATTCQKCVRAGGKHNDLENVGFTARHHTFFEMLGNFSFGDYFKKEAIAFAWELITRYYHIPTDKLRVTVFEKDDEAFDLWKAQGVRSDWIGRLGEKDNFWAAGDTGPCGPCTEIYYDWGEKIGCGKPQCAPGCDCPRFLEIWNLVFMQYNRDSSGKLTPLPKPSVDTGAGLERMAAVLQGVFTNYDTDVFKAIIASIEELTNRKYGANESDDISVRVIADHIRSCTFLMADGVTPSNESRGYVLRRILRRAIRHGKKLGQDKPFLFELVKTVAAEFGAVYPELNQNRKIVEVMMKEEEQRFHETLHRGMGLLEETMTQLGKAKSKVLPGDVAFKLYDTFGFPLDLIQVITAEHGFSVDEKSFNERMDKQRSLSSFNKGDNGAFTETLTKTLDGKRFETKFLGYEGIQSQGKLQLMIAADGNEATAFSDGDEGYLIFDQTPFYAESGGQVGDQGKIKGPGLEIEVVNTEKKGKVFLHQIKVLKGNLVKASAANLSLEVDSAKRQLTAINHTATHMLHAALREVLGERVKQAGSLVDAEHLRFDFTFPRGMTVDEIEKVEQIINREVVLGSEVTTREMSYDEAIKAGALAFFDEKYGDHVRVVQVSGHAKPFSTELCGGTHLKKISDIQLFKVTAESSVASGVRRIEAITAKGAIAFFRERDELARQAESKLNARGSMLLDKLDQVLSQVKQLQKENDSLKIKLAQSGGSGEKGSALHERSIDIPEKKLRLVAEVVQGSNAKLLRTLVDQIRDKLKDRTIVVLATESEGKTAICVGVTKDLLGEYDASKLVQGLAKAIGGTGGGRGDFAQAGGTNFAAVPKALEEFKAGLKQ